MSVSDFTSDELQGMFEFLDELRESGEPNMYGAAPYLVAEFGTSSVEARIVLKAWMETFGGGTKPAIDRALDALDGAE